MNDSRNPHSDLDDLLREMLPEEAGRLREVWDLVGDEEPIDDLKSVDTEEALHHVHARVEDRGSETASSSSAVDFDRADARNPRTRQQHTPWSVRLRGPTTAVLLVAVLVGALTVYWWQQPVTQTAPRGERLAFRLPDGSRVELNSGSTLRYERSFGDERLVNLNGEAFFDVTNGSRPFVVRTFNADIRVLGTRFNIRAWATDPAPSTMVTLVEGRVTLHPQNDSGRAVRLDPGDTRRVANAQSDSVRAVDVSVDAVTAWRRGDLIFKDRPLGQVLREVERRFAVTLTLQPPSLQQQRIYLALRQPEDVETVIRDIARAQNLQYRATSNGYALYR